MMEAVSFSETLISIYQTTQCTIPEGSHLRAHHRKNLKCYHKHFQFLCCVNQVNLHEWTIIMQ
jgi:hypothetical protein